MDLPVLTPGPFDPISNGGKSLAAQPEKVRVLVRNLRLLLLASRGVYPIAYLAPLLGFDGAAALVALQTGYTVADIIAKPFSGAMIVWIAIEKSHADGWSGSSRTTWRGSAL